MRNPVVLLTRTLDPDTDSWGGPVALKIENQIPRERWHSNHTLSIGESCVVEGCPVRFLRPGRFGFLRRHHCRNCGAAVCSNHSANQVFCTTSATWVRCCCCCLKSLSASAPCQVAEDVHRRLLIMQIRTSLSLPALLAPAKPDCDSESWWGGKDGREEQGVCSICLRAWGAADGAGQASIVLLCGHRFHRQCIERWLQSRFRSTCPMCRQDAVVTWA
mmetsp:Transcript_50536/g.96529  ORF Transcript_50536/g.96529 Transcript_50536/m.96529 type:complete len:218 (+) Transcript_50536:381-1034(+)